MALPTIRQFNYFITLVQYQHFGKAAEACFVSQSAFSVAIKEFESVMGGGLVDRTNKSVTITPKGKAVAAEAKQLMDGLNEMVKAAHHQQQPLSGKLRIGVIPTIAPFLLPRLLPLLRKDYPDLILYLQEDMSLNIYNRLMNGELDLLILALPYSLRNVEVMPLYSDPFLLACHKNTHHLNPERYELKKLQPESILLLEEGHCMRDHALSACHLRNIDQVNQFAASSLLTLIEMVDADLGITYLPQMAQDSPMLKNTQVKTWPLKQAGAREIGLVWRKGSNWGKEFNLFGEYLQGIKEAGLI
jgi:LysR family hydrogen peroxide-inducible transcriptional activator